MSPNDRAELLEKCLCEIQAGKPLEQVLVDHAPAAERLRPELETAVLARSLAGRHPIPAGAQARSRTKFLAAAGETRSPRPFAFFHLRLGTAALAAVLVLLLAAVVGTGFASAQSLPGDALYPVKITIERARLNFAPDPASRLTLEETFDKERAEDTGQLMRLGRSESMNFAGFLQGEPDEGWEVTGLPLWLSPSQERLAASYQGMYVEIQGTATTKGVYVQSMQARLFNLTGTVQQVQNGVWVVGGLNVHAIPQTKISARPEAGQTVYVTAMRQENGDLVALVISPVPETATYLPPTPEVENEHQAVSTSAPSSTATESWQEAMPTSAPESTDSTEEKMVTPENSGDSSEQEVAPQSEGGNPEKSPSSGSEDGGGQHSGSHSSGSGEDH